MDLESFDIQTIYAIIEKNLQVQEWHISAIFLLTQMGDFDNLASSLPYL